MTDSEKLALINTMIGDFWDFLTEEQQEDNAIGTIVSIQAVANFEGAANE